MYVYKQCPEAIVAVFPSDHFIREEDRFMRSVRRAAEVVARNPSRIVLLGVEPRHAETEYGYIVPLKETVYGFGTQMISAFVEKPDAAQARHLIRIGALWNTMTMVFKLGNLLRLVDEAHPVLSREFLNIFNALGTTEEQQSIERCYRYLEPVNFSRDIIERIAKFSPGSLLVLPVRQVFWSDLGSPARVEHVLTLLHKRERQPRDFSEPLWPGLRKQIHRPILSAKKARGCSPYRQK